MIIIKLKDILKEKNISGRKLSRDLGIRQPTVSDMCSNNSKQIVIANLDKICKYLNCEIEDILEYRE